MMCLASLTGAVHPVRTVGITEAASAPNAVPHGSSSGTSIAIAPCSLVSLKFIQLITRIIQNYRFSSLPLSFYTIPSMSDGERPNVFYRLDSVLAWGDGAVRQMEQMADMYGREHWFIREGLETWNLIGERHAEHELGMFALAIPSFADTPPIPVQVLALRKGVVGVPLFGNRQVITVDPTSRMAAVYIPVEALRDLPAVLTNVEPDASGKGVIGYVLTDCLEIVRHGGN